MIPQRGKGDKLSVSSSGFLARGYLEGAMRNVSLSLDPQLSIKGGGKNLGRVMCDVGERDTGGNLNFLGSFDRLVATKFSHYAWLFSTNPLLVTLLCLTSSLFFFSFSLLFLFSPLLARELHGTWPKFLDTIRAYPFNPVGDETSVNFILVANIIPYKTRRLIIQKDRIVIITGMGR